jgi:hypothetical protein
MLRWSGLAAAAGGALRIADSFLPGRLPENVLARIYLATDILLLLGIAGIWWARRGNIGVAGMIGAAAFVGGILTIRAAPFGFGSYPLGAALAAIGLAILALDLLWRRNAILAPLCWLAALGFGVAGSLGFVPPTMLAAAGIAFGVGFVAAGVALLRDQSSLAVR